MNTQISSLSPSSTLLAIALSVALNPTPLASGQVAAPGAPASLAQTPAATVYHVLKTFEVGGEGGWDYLTVDNASRHLFISRSTHTMVLDADTGKVAGDIADTAGVHGIAIATDLGRGFTSNGKAGTSTIFDLKTLAPIGTVKVGDNPDAILYDATTKRVFTFNGRSSDASVIDAAAGTVVGTIPLGGKPETGVSDGAGKIFVNIEDKSEIVEIDAKEMKVLAHWPIAPGEEPSGLAIDTKTHRLFTACGNEKMIVLDCESGKVVATLAIGSGVDGAAFDPTTNCAFSSNGDGTMTVVHEESPGAFSVMENATTARGARTIALDPKTHNLFLPSAKYEPAPEAKAGEKRPRPKMIAGTFAILVVGK
jgi:YVTN family beta-propeller protein